MHVWTYEYMYNNAREHMHVYMLGGKHAHRYALRSVLTYMSKYEHMHFNARERMHVYMLESHPILAHWVSSLRFMHIDTHCELH